MRPKCKTQTGHLKLIPSNEPPVRGSYEPFSIDKIDLQGAIKKMVHKDKVGSLNIRWRLADVWLHSK